MIKSSVKTNTTKKEYPNMTLDELKQMVKELNKKAREGKK